MQMTPIVDGLEEQYQAQIAFIRLNAKSPDGEETFQHYGLPGHPSYVLLTAAGEELWRGVGEQTASVIEMEIQKHIDKNN